MAIKQHTVHESILDKRIYNGKNKHFVQVTCECGDVNEIPSYTLTIKKGRKSCAKCARVKRRKYKIGDRFDKLVITGYFKTESGRNHAVCLCDCGGEKVIRPELLRINDTNNCGCAPRGSWKGLGEISGTFFYRMKRNAKVRKIEFNCLTKKDVWNLFLKQNRKCALTGCELTLDKDNTTASLDRIDSNLPYSITNVQWVHKDINKMKMDLSQERFFELCKKVVSQNGL